MAEARRLDGRWSIVWASHHLKSNLNLRGGRLMLKSEIKVRTHYAIREKRIPGTPLQRVKILEYIRGNKWKAKWIDPNPGLIDYIESGQLIVPWREHKRFLRDEASAEQLWEHAVRNGYVRDSPVDAALVEIFEDVGDSIEFHRGVLSGLPEAIDRVKARARMDPGSKSRLAHIDRHGKAHLPFDEALELARRFCAAEPSTILVGVEATERGWSQSARRGEDYIVPLLNEYRAAWALIRQWAGHDAAIAEREARIQQLERLVWDAVYTLQNRGFDDEAFRLRRALEEDRSG